MTLVAGPIPGRTWRAWLTARGWRAGSNYDQCRHILGAVRHCPTGTQRRREPVGRWVEIGPWLDQACASFCGPVDVMLLKPMESGADGPGYSAREPSEAVMPGSCRRVPAERHRMASVL